MKESMNITLACRYRMIAFLEFIVQRHKKWKQIALFICCILVCGSGIVILIFSFHEEQKNISKEQI